MLVYYDEEPKKIKYESLPDGTANVYLRQNVKQVDQVQTSTDGTETAGERTPAYRGGSFLLQREQRH